jgi:V/A-type H+-transporting ATPase subunit I
VASESALSVLSEFKISKSKQSVLGLNGERVLEKIRDINAKAERKRVCVDTVVQNSAEIDRFSKWGEVNPEDFAFLAQKGVYLSFYEIPSKDYGALPESVKTIFVSSDKAQTRFLLVGKANRQRPAEMPPQALNVVEPRLSTRVLATENERLKHEIEAIDVSLFGEAVYKTEIAAYGKKLAKDVEFENVFTGMYDDVAEGERRSNLAWLSGFAPAADVDAIKKTASDEHWAVSVQDPEPEDTVPTKLKNNKLVSLIYPLTDFLETVPGYTEYDISGWFLLFFCVFFGMIFGDAGYGSLLALIAIGGLAAKGKKAPQGLKLLLLLAISNIAWGVMTCTWFGIPPDALPQALRNISVPAISNASPNQDAVSKNLQVVCFSIALVQLCIAHIKGIFRCLSAKGGRLKFLSEIGSIAMLAGMYNVILMLVVQIDPFLTMNIIVGLLVGGFVFTFVFANYEGSIGKSILSSLQNFISVVLGITNVFSDIMSYIRLWAVGLAGSSISLTVNTMAGPTLGNFLIFLGILLLVFGHGLNIILNVLSVLVHGVRLNTLEFSSHLGISWSGIAYKPFKEAAN